jgi:hypothetical protein
MCVALVIGLLILTVQPMIVSAQSYASATTSGFGAAFAYAQTIGPISYTQAGSIGDGDASAIAITGFSSAFSNTWTSGPSAAFAQAIGSPFGSAAYIQAASFFGGMAMGSAGATP